MTKWILTYTGQRVDEPGGEGAPNLSDIAVQTGRVARFAGATVMFWPVLLHHFVVRGIVAYEGGDLRAQLEALLHDAHECLTGDVPSPFKPREMGEFQEELDVRIRASLGLDEPDPETHLLVKRADTAALLAEGLVLGPPGSAEWVRSAGGAEPYAVDIVHTILQEYPGYVDVLEPNGRAVQDYVTLVESLLTQVKGA